MKENVKEVKSQINISLSFYATYSTGVDLAPAIKRFMKEMYGIDCVVASTRIQTEIIDSYPLKDKDK